MLTIAHLSEDSDIVAQFPEVFSEKIGLLSGFEHKIVLKSHASPVVHKVRKVPHLMLEPLKADME